MTPVRTGLAVLVLALLELAAPAAEAETWSGADAARDVRQVVVRAAPDHAGGCATTRPRPARHDRRRDVLGLAVDHGVDDVVVTATFRAPPRRDRTAFPTFSLGTPEHRYLVNVWAHDGRVVETTLGKDPQVDVDRCLSRVGSEVVRCRGLDVRRHPGADTIVVRVPRRCLEAPAWVRAGFAIQGSRRRPGTDRLTVYTDVWGGDGTPTTREVLLPPLGPPVAAG